MKKELEDKKLDLTTLHWFKKKSKKTTAKVITFQKNHFILPTEFWTGKVSVNSSTKDQKAVFDWTNIILSKVDKVTAPNNIKAILDGSIEIKSAPFNIKGLALLRVFNENFFLYDNENMVVETYKNELNRNILSYGVISFLGKPADLDNKLHLITPGQKLKFSVKNGFYKNKEEFELRKVHTDKSFNTPRDNILNFAILLLKKNSTIGQKR